ncbi:hypothetical protein HN682_01750 [Candidatus Peregrinibacteria bacterium]|nr:hypothetical protein [Candidatus Scalindua sp.]MBT7928630.1 hypothetical protein [Candidatus Peregrinibacteria bacterium]
MLNVEGVYADFIDSHNEDHSRKYEDYEGWFGASSAGQCFKKQYYRYLKVEPQGFDDRVARILRLGTIVHEDMAKAVEFHIKNRDPDSKSKLFVEKQVKIPTLKVLGHIDMLEQDNGISRVFDLKTVASYKWRKKFGRTTRKFRPDPNSDLFYKMQLGSYGLALLDESSSVEMYLCWYNKDTSAMKKPIQIEGSWISAAKDYWIELWNVINETESPDDMIPGVTNNVPMDKEWECNMCPYNHICNSRYNTKRK